MTKSEKNVHRLYIKLTQLITTKILQNFFLTSKTCFKTTMSDFKIFAITRVTQSESLLLDIKSRDALRVDEKKGTMTLIRNESYVRHGDEARFEEVKIVGEAPKIFSLNVHVETKNISWDSKNRVRFVLKNKDVVIIQFVSRFVARNAAEALSRLVSSSSSELKFTYPDDTAAKPKVSEITIFGGDGKSDENAFIFFEYPPLLGCSRDRSSLSNLRKIQVNEDRCPSFYSGKHFNSLVNAYETAGFSRVSKNNTIVGVLSGPTFTRSFRNGEHSSRGEHTVTYPVLLTSVTRIFLQETCEHFERILRIVNKRKL